MEIASFDDLLRAAREQPQPQRLLFVFTRAVLPDDCTVEQRARFAAGQGGALAPLMCVDKTPDELDTFEAFADESKKIADDWAVVFVASLPGRNGCAPTSKEADKPLERMVESIKLGAFHAFLPFDRRGEPMLLS